METNSLRTYRTIIAVEWEKDKLDENGEVVNKVMDILYLPLDVVSSKNVSASSNIISQPLQNGDMMSDHMYRNPVSVQLSGTFALNGRNWADTTYDDIMGSGTDRLTSIQSVFEEIKNKGYFCKIMNCATDVTKSDTFSYDDTGAITSNVNVNSTRFLMRDNMVLTQISWGEFTNYLTYSFSFTEVISVETVTEYVEDDLDLPNISVPAAQSLGKYLQQSPDSLVQPIFKLLYDNGYMEDNFIKYIVENIKDGTIEYGKILLAAAALAASAGIVVGIGVGVGAGLGALGLTTAAIVPAGTVFVGAALLIGAVAVGIGGLISVIKNRHRKSKMFKAGKDVMSNVDRLNSLIDNVIAKVGRFTFDCEIYTLKSNNPNQQVCLSVGGVFYYITFTKTIRDPYWTTQISISSFEDTSSISTKREDFPVTTSFSELNPNQNIWFRDESHQYQVYICNPSLGLNSVDSSYNKTEADIKCVKEDLSSYMIIVSKGDPKNTIGKLNDVITQALEDEGFVM